MGRSKSRGRKTAKVKPGAPSVPMIEELSIDRFSIAMNWVLSRTIPLDSARPSTDQLFTLIEYIGSTYTGAEFGDLVILRCNRCLYVAKVTRDGALSEQMQISFDTRLRSSWEGLRICWNPKNSITDNLIDLRFPGGTLV